MSNEINNGNVEKPVRKVNVEYTFCNSCTLPAVCSTLRLGGHKVHLKICGICLRDFVPTAQEGTDCLAKQ